MQGVVRSAVLAMGFAFLPALACSSPSITYLTITADAGPATEVITPDAAPRETEAGAALPEAGLDAAPDAGVAGSGLDGVSPSRAAVSCKQLLMDGYSRGRTVYWLNPDGVGGSAGAFQVECDMDQDNGGWTLLGRGKWWLVDGDSLDPSMSNGMLKPAPLARVLAVTGRQFRTGSGTQRLFVHDTTPIFAVTYHYWRTNAASVACATSYAAVVANTMVTTSTKQMRDDPLAIADHINGTSSGWILFHAADTFNASGTHPCAFGQGLTPTSSALGDLWVR